MLMTGVSSRQAESDARRAPRAKPRELALTLQNPARAASVPRAQEVHKIVNLALTRSAEICVRFASSKEARALNLSYRGRDYATNILSFAYHRDAEMLSGDLVLCPAVIRKEALAQNKPLAAHYAHLLVHGVLHLEGWEHEDAESAKRMEAQERKLLAQIGVANPYA